MYKILNLDIYKYMKIKSNYLDTFISCPATGKIINTTFLDKDLYTYYYNNGYDYIFDRNTNADYKSEIESYVDDDILKLNNN